MIQPKCKDLLVKRCPFCGCWELSITNTHTACYTIACDDCGAEVSGESFEKSWKSKKSKVSDHLRAIRSAADKWNLRVSDPFLEFRPAQLECHISWGVGVRYSNLGGTFGRSRGEPNP